MRPDPEQRRQGAKPESIIYLGDVRKRRRSRTRAPDRQYIAALVLVGLVSWTSWLLVATNLAPERLLTYLAFFAPLAAAVFATTVLVSYAGEWRLGRSPSLRACVRRGALATAVVTANLALLAAHRWNLVVAAATVVAVVAADLLVEHRARSRR